ncbi:MAG: V-type ATP synthase subunit I [Candidatus Methanofastidiosum methylothiophilum]|uniref:A-type ATP synthase subunit I n=1 Tax=Candidatus Methanofastidiosum methylothiophilum TaxID=1705564 RepID=A0A150IKP7_9EURY|nr:MAG: V-type ATP synthase subunit I [Candidatus Methanofastidiosum methylthiophilus]KYC47700.1 MAG: V-type ATP synthase subunit I [Candidatus Methanofastidiosum methylthiophilus]KYC50294.1 MAG: V-type ATP synthase subunit I [Candidatus Methanofastidiosum methylthiophilus]
MSSNERMTKITLVGTKDIMKGTIEILHSLKIIHIIDFKEQDETFEIGKSLGEVSIFSELLLSIRSILSKFDIRPDKVKTIYIKREVSRELEKEVYETENTIKMYSEKIEKISSILKEIDRIKSIGEITEIGIEKKLISSIDTLLSSKSRLEKQRDKLREEMDSIIKEKSAYLLQYEDFLSSEIEKMEAPLRFTTTKNTFIVEGWIPENKFQELKNILKKKFGDRVNLDKIKYSDEEPVPVEFKHPTPVKPFELLLELFEYPKTREIDPTFAIFITFPLFYGIMLGDIGYGLVIFFASLFMKTKFKTEGWKMILGILEYSSLYTIAFGFIDGEFFGFDIFALLGIEEIFGFKMPILNRIVDFMPIMVLSISIGVLHVLLGLTFGFINVYRSHNLKEAILKKGAWIILIFSIIFIASSVYISNIFLYFGSGLLLISLILLVVGEGFIGLIEIFGIMSNILSYVRLMAIGLSSVGIAIVINSIVTDIVFPKGGIFVLLGYSILILGHIGNILLGILASFLHALRLHYVEFFTKFYEGGGIKYKPFGI